MTVVRRIWLGFAVLIPLVCLGCIKSGSGAESTSGTTLYLYDGAGTQVLVWKDMDATYAASTPPGADLTLTSSAFARSSPVAWGGMVMDTQRNLLYLLYQDGSVIRINQLRSQTGSIPSNNVSLFTLDSSSRLTGSVFGQLALDTQNDLLYACESGTSGTSRVWVVNNPDSIPNSGTSAFVTVADDESGTGRVGAAAGQGSVYAYFASGNQVVSGLNTYNGPRLRKGTSSAFAPSNVIIGDKTGIDQSAAGTLALDTAGSTVYVGLDVGSTSANSPTGGAPIVAFQTGQFGLSVNQAPRFWLGGTLSDTLTALSHAGTKGWLVGLTGTGGVPVQTIQVWKQPASGVVQKPLALGPSTAQYLAAALDGTGS